MASMEQLGTALKNAHRAGDEQAARRLATEIKRRRAMPEAAPQSSGMPQYGGTAMNTTAGINEGIYGTLGAPVDLMRGAMNLGIRGINAATGSELSQIPDDSFGGSKSIAGMMGAISPAMDPANTVADSSGDRIARGIGQGIGYTLAPEAALAGLSRAGAVGPRMTETAGRMFGRGETVGATAANAGVGGAAGAGAVAAEDAASEPYKPLASLLGGLAAGGGAALATGIPGALREGARVAGDFAAPLSRSGQEQLAGRKLLESATDPDAVRRSLEGGARELVPGSKPTTFQQTGDMGLGALERGAAAKRPELFNQRRAEQNTARREALGAIQPDGGAETVSRGLRDRFRELDQELQKDIDILRGGVKARNESLGPSMRPEEAGEAMRAVLQRRRDAAMKRENSLWSAVDPDGTLALSATNAVRTAGSIGRSLPRSARPPSGEEQAIYGVLGSYEDVVPFRELSALRTRVSTAITEERSRHGKTPTWARLVQVRNAIERDLETAVSERSRQPAGNSGGLNASPTGRTVSGGSAVFTPSGRRVETEFVVVDADRLTDSAMPNYPAGLQPRDRSRVASDLQIQQMARELQPERLGASSTASDGAPIIGPDGVVESGNGRVQAIRKAYSVSGNSAASYRRFIEDQGFSTKGLRNPVLVRRRVTDMDEATRARFAQEANAPSTLGMSAGEQAATDAKRMTPDLLKLYQGGDVTDAANRDFARAFLRTVSDRGQEGQFVSADGKLALDGAQRMRNALLHSAYGDAPLVAALTETGDENIRAFGRALTDIAGDVARVKAGVEAGRIDAGADLSPALVEAADIVQDARRKGIKLADAVAQMDAFSRVSDEALNVLRAAYGDGLNARLSRENFAVMMRAVAAEAEQQTTDARLFGEAANAGDIIQGAIARYGGRGQIEAQSYQPAPYGAGYGSARGGDRPTLDGARGPEGSTGSGRNGSGDRSGTGSLRTGRSRTERDILTDPILEPNFSEADLGRLRKATDASRNRVGTFDNRQFGPVLARPSDNAPYNMEDWRVASRVFTPGAGGFERIQQFRQAAGTKKSMNAVEAYAIDRLRSGAMNEDGTFNPNKVEAFRRAHKDALRALPELDDKLQSAERLSKAMIDASAKQKRALEEAQQGVIGRIMNLDDPLDVTRAVGSIFGRQDAVLQMGALRSKIGGNEEAAMACPRKSGPS